MARIKVDDIVYHLSGEFTKALDDTMAQFAPGVQYNRHELFRFFNKAVYKHCGAWENVPDGSVEG
jgi:hypothetical protein